MPPVYYQISHSRAVQESFERLLDTARAEGRFAMALRAAHYRDELGYDPMSFGESRGHLAAAELHLRIAFARPWCVRFGVHEGQRIVFLRSFRLVR
jgi:hypothetical protein